MFKKLFYGALVLLALAYVFRERNSQSKGSNVAHEHISGEFHSLNIQGNFNIFLSESDEYMYKVISQDQDSEDIDMYIKNQTLYIKSPKKTWLQYTPKDIEVNVSTPGLRRIIANGAVNLQTQNPIKSDELELELSGASKGNIEIDVEEFIFLSSGASNVKIEGKAYQAQMKVSGASEIKAFDLLLKKLYLQISGAGHAEVNVLQELDVHVSGAGSVKYQGSPSEISQQVSGAGSVRKVGN